MSETFDPGSSTAGRKAKGSLKINTLVVFN